MSALACAAGAAVSEFDRWWESPGTWVEPPNRRRGGESGVQVLRQREAGRLLYCKRQSGHTFRTLWHPFGRPTVLRELGAYRAFSRLGIATPRLVYGGARRQPAGWQGLLVTEALQGFVSLEQWYAGAQSPALRQSVLRQLAVTLARLHRAGWQHGCCYAKHVFVRLGDAGAGEPRVEIALLDLEKSRRRWRADAASRHDLGQLARHRGTMPDGDLRLLHDLHRAAMSRNEGFRLV